jgi:hypothetical protein
MVISSSNPPMWSGQPDLVTMRDVLTNVSPCPVTITLSCGWRDDAHAHGGAVSSEIRRPAFPGVGKSLRAVATPLVAGIAFGPMVRRYGRRGEVLLIWLLLGHVAFMTILYLTNDRYLLLLVPPAIALLLSGAVGSTQACRRDARGSRVLLPHLRSTTTCDHPTRRSFAAGCASAASNVVRKAAVALLRMLRINSAAARQARVCGPRGL